MQLLLKWTKPNLCQYLLYSWAAVTFLFAVLRLLTVIFKRFCLYKVNQKTKLELHEHIFSCRRCMICLTIFPVCLDKVLIWFLSFLHAQLLDSECLETDSLLKWDYTNLSEAVHGSSSAWGRWSDEALGVPCWKESPKALFCSWQGAGGGVVAGCQVTHRSQLIWRGWEELAQTPTGTGLQDCSWSAKTFSSEEIQNNQRATAALVSCGPVSAMPTFHIWWITRHYSWVIIF